MKSGSSPSKKSSAAKISKDIKKAMPIVADKFKQAGEMVQSGVRKVIPHRHDEPETRYFKILGLTFVGLIMIAVFAGLATFLLTLRSPEAVTVPRVSGMDLPTAMEALQEYGLVSHIEQRFYADPATKGQIMEQDPAAGSSVRVGREVTLVYSKGAVLDKIGNYIGRNIEDVRQELRITFPGDNPTLSIGTTSYTFDQSEAGTIISQDPAAGAPLREASQLKLLVSRGKDASLKEVPSLVGQPYLRAIETLIAQEIPFGTTIINTGADVVPGTIALQSPEGGQSLDAKALVNLTILEPDNVGPNQSFGVYSYQLPDFAVPVDVTITAVTTSGTSTTLYKFKHPGGSLTVPYLVANGTELLLSVYGKELDKRLIGK